MDDDANSATVTEGGLVHRAAAAVSVELVLRLALVAIGVWIAWHGAHRLLTSGMQPRQLLSVAKWLAAGSIAHDLVVAPVSVLLGRVLRRPLGRPFGSPVPGNAVRGVWLALGSVLIIGVPLIGGARHRVNPTVVPGRPGLNILVSLGLFLAGGLIVTGVSVLRSARRAHRGESEAP